MKSETAIDGFITNITCKNLKISGIITHISDHDGQLFEMFDIKSVLKCVTKRLCRRFTKNTTDLFFKVYQATVENKYNIFYSIITNAF